MSKMVIIHSPKGNAELVEFLFAEPMLRLLLIHDQAFFGQGIPDLLEVFRQLAVCTLAWNVLTLYTARLSSLSI